MMTYERGGVNVVDMQLRCPIMNGAMCMNNKCAMAVEHIDRFGGHWGCGLVHGDDGRVIYRELYVREDPDGQAD